VSNPAQTVPSGTQPSGIQWKEMRNVRSLTGRMGDLTGRRPLSLDKSRHMVLTMGSRTPNKPHSSNPQFVYACLLINKSVLQCGEGILTDQR
jgi:hypothetical protein